MWFKNISKFLLYSLISCIWVWFFDSGYADNCRCGSAGWRDYIVWDLFPSWTWWYETCFEWATSGMTGYPLWEDIWSTATWACVTTADSPCDGEDLCLDAHRIADPNAINWACWSSNGAYFYEAPNTNLCIAWTTGSITTTSTGRNRGCNWINNWSDASCQAFLKPLQPTACGIPETTFLRELQLGPSSYCIAGSGHSDSTILWYIQLLSFAGGGVSPWTRVCGWTGHTTTNCTAGSQGGCHASVSWGNQSFTSLTSSSPNLCANGIVAQFTGISMSNSPFYLAQYQRNCIGSQPSAFEWCHAYQAAAPTPWLCNAGINGQSLSYNQIQNALLCTQGIPSITLLPPTPTSGSQWTWSCIGLGQAASANCSANAVTNGACISYTAEQLTQPTQLCSSWIPSSVSISSGSYLWLCNWTNWGISSPLCSANCMNWHCSTATTTWTINTWSTNTWYTSDGKTSPVSLNQLCSDTDGCVCYNVTIVNWSRCLANTLTGTTDSTLTPIDIWEVCLDADWCICNANNNIINGSVCQTDWLTWTLPGQSDLIISQSITSGTIARRGIIEISINYYNRWPNIATGTKIEYYLSPLVSKFRTTAPYTLTQVTQSGYVQSSEYQNNVLVFPVGELATNEAGKIIVQITLNASLTDEEVVNATSIASRVSDPKPLDNVQKIILWLDSQQSTTLGVYIINPFLGIQNMIQQYETMNSRLRIDPVFDDVQRWDDNYMSVMTVVRNGIFEGYRYKFSRSFGGDKCTSRIESVNVVAKMMYTAGSSDIYVSRPKGTAYVDSNNLSSQAQNFVNWAHERWLLKYLKPKNIGWSLYLEPNKEITQQQLKDILFAIYNRYNIDPSTIESLLNEKNDCVTRYDLADAISQMLRGNPNIMMGYNDEFLKQIITRTNSMAIVERREEIRKIIDKLRSTAPAILESNGYDAESLVGILEAALLWKSYNAVNDVSASEYFLN